MRWLTLIVAIAVIVAISTLAFAPGSPVFKKADGRYLVIAHFPPFKQAELEKALDEISRMLFGPAGTAMWVCR